MAQQDPERWQEATTTKAELQRWHQERLEGNYKGPPPTPEQKAELVALIERLRVKHKDAIERAWAKRRR